VPVKESEDAISRAVADASANRRAEARQRLKGYLVAHPESMAARKLLTELYRADQHPDEAGRWGYLLRDVATPSERASYERACAHRMAPAWTYTYMRRGLHWAAPVELADDYAGAILRELDDRAEREAADFRRRITPLHVRLAGRIARWFSSLGWGD